MKNEATVTVKTCGDAEIDAIALCIKAFEGVREINARVRIAEYLMDRYGLRAERQQ